MSTSYEWPRKKVGIQTLEYPTPKALPLRTGQVVQIRQPAK